MDPQWNTLYEVYTEYYIWLWWHINFGIPLSPNHWTHSLSSKCSTVKSFSRVNVPLEQIDSHSRSRTLHSPMNLDCTVEFNIRNSCITLLRKLQHIETILKLMEKWKIKLWRSRSIKRRMLGFFSIVRRSKHWNHVQKVISIAKGVMARNCEQKWNEGNDYSNTAHTHTIDIAQHFIFSSQWLYLFRFFLCSFYTILCHNERIRSEL